jgi:hypothetical protein
MLLAHLAVAERHIVQGKVLLERQEHLLVELERGGYHIADASAAVVTMKDTQTLHVEDRDRILKALEELNAALGELPVAPPWAPVGRSHVPSAGCFERPARGDPVAR